MTIEYYIVLCLTKFYACNIALCIVILPFKQYIIIILHLLLSVSTHIYKCINIDKFIKGCWYVIVYSIQVQFATVIINIL